MEQDAGGGQAPVLSADQDGDVGAAAAERVGGDRIEIADGLHRGDAVKTIAVRIGKSYQTVYREINRNRKPDGRYQPWYAHNQTYVRRRRPKPRNISVPAVLAPSTTAQKTAGLNRRPATWMVSTTKK